MESKSVQIIKFKSSGEIELTLEGIQLFQNIQGPLGIISVIGPAGSGKTTLCKKLISSSIGTQIPSTTGIWASSETFKLVKRDDDGTEYKLDLLVIDCESIVDRKDKNKSRGLEILTLACLLSSHIVYFTDQPVHTQKMSDLDIFAELPNLISIRKNVDSFKSLHEYLPVLTWVIHGPDLKAPEEAAGSYFEKILSSQGSAEASRIKTSLKSFFRRRFCFNSVAGNKGQYHRLVEFIQQATPSKAIFGINLTGPIMCSMLQSYVNRISKKTPAIIQRAFNRAVAAEARKMIEKLYVRYLEQMSEIESRLPCSEEELWIIHNTQVLDLNNKFDRTMAEFNDCPEIREEKKTVIYRIATFYEELKEENLKKSANKSNEEFDNAFADVLKENFCEDLNESEEMIAKALAEYFEKAAGPAALKVLVEKTEGLARFLCANIREVVAMNECIKIDMEKEIKDLKKSREKVRNNEQRLQQMVENLTQEFDLKLADKDKNFNELQVQYSCKLNNAESKIKNLNRELKAKNQELEHFLQEKEALLDMQRNIFNNKEAEYLETIEKLKEKVRILEDEQEKAQNKLEKSLNEKEEEIFELKQKEKLSESATDSIQDYSILSGLRRDISEMFMLIETEQNNNSRFVSQMDKISSLQAELNKCRLKEIENRNKLIEEYDEKIYSLKDELEKATQEIQDMKNQLPASRMTEKNESNPKIDETESIKLASLESEIKLKTEQNNLLAEMIAKRDEQIESLYKVVETHKKQFEGLEYDFEDKAVQLKKLKSEISLIRDDNEVLIGLMGYSLEVLQKKRNIQAISLAQIGNVSNRARVIKIFKKFGIPFDV